MAYDALRAKYGYAPAMSDADVVRATRARPEFAHESNEDFAQGVDAYEAQHAAKAAPVAAPGGFTSAPAEATAPPSGNQSLGGQFVQGLVDYPGNMAKDVGSLARLIAAGPLGAAPVAINMSPEERSHAVGGAALALGAPAEKLVGGALEGLPVPALAKRLLAGAGAWAPVGAVQSLAAGRTAPGQVLSSSAVAGLGGAVGHASMGGAAEPASPMMPPTGPPAPENPGGNVDRFMAEWDAHQPVPEVPDRPPASLVNRALTGKAGAALQLVTPTSTLLKAQSPEAAQAEQMIQRFLVRKERNVGEAMHGLSASGLGDIAPDSPEDKAFTAAWRTGKMDGLTPEVAQAARAVRAHMQDMQQQFLAAGHTLAGPDGQRLPFPDQTERVHFPEVTPGPKALAKGPVRDAVAQSLVEKGWAKSPAQAQAMVDDLRAAQENRGGGALGVAALMENKGLSMADALKVMDRARRTTGGIPLSASADFARRAAVNPFADPSGVRAITRYVHEAGPALARTQELGDQESRLNEAITRIGDPARQAEARTLKNVMLGVKQPEPSAMRHVGTLSKILTTTATGPMTTLKHATQGINTMVASDVAPWVKGFSRAFTPEGRAIAERSGALNESSMGDYLDQAGYGQGKASRTYSNAIGLRPTMLANRQLFSNIGHAMAEKWGRALEANPASVRARQEVTLLGLDPGKIAREGFHEGDALDGALAFTNRTIQRSHAADLPPWATQTEIGRSIARLRSFAYQQAKLVGQETVGRAAQGQTLRALRNAGLIGTVFPTVGAAVSWLNKYFSGNRQPKSVGEAYGKGLAEAGTSGLAGSAYGAGQAALRSKSSEPVVKFLAGPAAERGATLAEGSLQAVLGKKDRKGHKLTPTQRRDMIGAAVPAVGYTVAPWFVPSPGHGDSGLPALLRAHGVPLPRPR